MRYFGVGVVMIVIGIPLELGIGELFQPLFGMALIVTGGLCFVADAVTRLTEELREQSQCAEAVETLRRRGNRTSADHERNEQLDEDVREPLGITVD